MMEDDAANRAIDINSHDSLEHGKKLKYVTTLIEAKCLII